MLFEIRKLANFENAPLLSRKVKLMPKYSKLIFANFTLGLYFSYFIHFTNFRMLF
jgi:hypothetical protein